MLAIVSRQWRAHKFHKLPAKIASGGQGPDNALIAEVGTGPDFTDFPTNQARGTTSRWRFPSWV
jgi:hypothetical protein